MAVSEVKMISSSSAKCAVPNGVLFLTDKGGGVAPEPERGAMFLSTASCITIGCMVDSEGETDILVGGGREVDPGWRAAFDAILSTPSRDVVVSTVEGQTVLSSPVPRASTHVRVWVNHPTEPDRVIIGCD